MRVLIAEDDPITRKVLEANLHRLDYQVVSACDGMQAWNQYTSETFSVIVSDWLMPDMDGLSLCKKIRENKSQNYTYFILLTVRKEREDCRQAMEVGVDDFLTKPVNFDDLRNRLRVAERILNYTTQIRELKSLLPICSYCKAVRDDENYWQQIESYIHTQTGTDFSHGICPRCFEEHVQPQLDRIANHPKT